VAAYVLVSVVALGASLLTFFTGFGLGTLLLPAFLVFFPAPVAVALTGVVHLLNSLFKLGLVGRQADGRVVLLFGAPALLAAAAGAAVLLRLTDLPPLLSYAIGERLFQVTSVKLTIGLLMIVFAWLELSKRLEGISFPSRYLPLGGVLTGFFGGLSGHQGALRSAFLVRSGLSKEAFIATGVVVATIVDITRLTVYATGLQSVSLGEHGSILLVATLSAFAGAFAGSRLVKKVTLRGLQRLVAAALAVIAIGVASGVL
jgi:uncharacterized membrane protein YfcA